MGCSIKRQKSLTVVGAFGKLLNNLKSSEAKSKWCKPNKIWVRKGSEFYINSFKKWLKENGIEMYSTHNEGNSVVAERFIRTLKNKINKHMTVVSKKCILIH